MRFFTLIGSLSSVLELGDKVLLDLVVFCEGIEEKPRPCSCEVAADVLLGKK